MIGDAQNGMLSALGINCLRSFPAIGPVVWGDRTLRGADALADDFKYISVRRLLLYIEESVRVGIQWAVFEPNNEALWSELRLAVGTFLQGLFLQGGLAGSTAGWFVNCDTSTTTQSDVDNGIVNIEIGVAPTEAGGVCGDSDLAAHAAVQGLLGRGLAIDVGGEEVGHVLVGFA